MGKQGVQQSPHLPQSHAQLTVWGDLGGRWVNQRALVEQGIGYHFQCQGVQGGDESKGRGGGGYLVGEGGSLVLAGGGGVVRGQKGLQGSHGWRLQGRGREGVGQGTQTSKLTPLTAFMLVTVISI